MSSQIQTSSTVDSLPKQFVSAMRTLFDIMDDKHTGYVNFSDIENRWQDDGTKGLPKGVLESLRKVTPSNGMLSFERFCTGLKICLLRNQVENRKPKNLQPNRSPSAPILDLDDDDKPPPPNLWSSEISNTNYAISKQRTLSMPQLDKKDLLLNEFENQNMIGPPKPPRNIERNNIDRAEIRNALQNWQLGKMLDEKRNLAVFNNYNGRSSGDGKSSGDHVIGLYQKKSNVRRREPRRHTLQNGIDYNMLKKMKQIEQEKNLLMDGLAAVDRAREWYLKQISVVQEKMRYLGRTGSHTEQWTEAQQEKLELQRARILEVNRHLETLIDSWERGGLPLHMNLAVHHNMASHNSGHNQDNKVLTRLKQQNHLLTEEVNKKSERIVALEREKATLIRELLQSRNTIIKHSSSQDEVVF